MYPVFSVGVIFFWKGNKRLVFLSGLVIFMNQVVLGTSPAIHFKRKAFGEVKKV